MSASAGKARHSAEGGRTCLYCGQPATTRDHVPPKLLLELPLPANLRTVPSCAPCNGGWSLDEEYLAILLSHIGTTPALEAKIEAGGKFDRALARSHRLDDRLVDALSVDEAGNVAIAFETGRVVRVLQKVAMGLHALRYGRGPGPGEFRCVAMAGPGHALPLHLRAALHYPSLARRKPWTTVQPGVFSFVFAELSVSGEKAFLCFMELHQTLVAVLACPPAVGPGRRRLDSPPW